MTTLLVILLNVLAAVVVTIASRREDTPAARPAARMWADLRATRWWRIALAVICVIGGGLTIALLSTARAALYGLGVAVAAACCWTASRAALSRRPCRVRLEFA
jgi:hypothetical protein